MERTRSLDFLCLESASIRSTSPYQAECSNLRKANSLPNLLHSNESWFVNSRKATRSHSLEYLASSENRKNDADQQDLRTTECRPTNRLLFDDHSLPKSISESFFNELMRYERNRLRTFKNWPSHFVTPGDVSKAGFYYLSTGDLVRCFECKVQLNRWEPGDQAILEHYKNSSQCPLINGYEVGNVPIDLTPFDVLQEHIDELRMVLNENVIYNLDDLSDQGFEEMDVLVFDRENIVPHNTQMTDQLFELMRSEEMRLKTFDTWPSHLVDKVKPADLAACGYFFTTIRDKVICAFCKVPAWDWQPTDVPIKEHYKHNPECPLLNDRECGNQPIQPVLFAKLLLEFQDIAPTYSNVDFLQFTNFCSQLSVVSL